MPAHYCIRCRKRVVNPKVDLDVDPLFEGGKKDIGYFCPDCGHLTERLVDHGGVPKWMTSLGLTTPLVFLSNFAATMAFIGLLYWTADDVQGRFGPIIAFFFALFALGMWIFSRVRLRIVELARKEGGEEQPTDFLSKLE